MYIYIYIYIYTRRRRRGCPDARPGLPLPPPASVAHTDTGLMKITTHLDHTSHCKMTSGTNSSN